MAQRRRGSNLRRGTRAKGDNITSPLESWGVESINKNFDLLFKDLRLTSTGQLLDGEHVDTNLASPTQGALIVGDDSTPSKWDVLPIGAANTVLRTDGLFPEWDKVDLVTDVTNVLEVEHGGTNTSSYTAGSVVFAGAGGLTLTEDNANFFWDDANNRLGIGTNTPDAPLEVNVPNLGTVNDAGVKLTNNTAATALEPRQFSPRLTFRGQAWDTSGGGSSVANRVSIYARVLTGVDTGAFFAIADDSNGAGSFTDQFYLGSAVAGGSPDFRIRDGNIVFRNAGRGVGFVSTPLTDVFNSNFAISGDVSGGLNRIVVRAVPGFLFIEANNASAVPGVTPSMEFRNFDGSTAVPIVGIRHRATKGGGPSAGFGTRQQYQADSTTTADQNQGALDVVWSDPAHATRSADVVVVLVDNAAAQAEKFRFKSTGEQLLIAAGLITFTGRAKVSSPADSQVLLTDNAASAFDRLMFGGTTNSFPALKRNAAVLETKLADDSAYAQHKALEFSASSANFLMRTSVAWTDGAAAAAGTLTNAPAAGDPTKWIPVDDNGTTRYVPAW